MQLLVNFAILCYVLLILLLVLTSMLCNLQSDANLRSELEADVEEECAKLGPVDSVKVLYICSGINRDPNLSFLLNSNFPP